MCYFFLESVNWICHSFRVIFVIAFQVIFGLLWKLFSHFHMVDWIQYYTEQFQLCTIVFHAELIKVYIELTRDGRLLLQELVPESESVQTSRIDYCVCVVSGQHITQFLFVTEAQWRKLEIWQIYIRAEYIICQYSLNRQYNPVQNSCRCFIEVTVIITRSQ